MDDTLDRSLKRRTPRQLLRRFMEVMDAQDTPAPKKPKGAAAKKTAKKTQSAKKTNRKSIQSTGNESLDSEDLHQSKPLSFMSQSFNASVIQGMNQTYANVVAPDSDSSSIASPVMGKATKWHTMRKRKLEDASLPLEMVSKSSSKKKSKKAVPPPTDSSLPSEGQEAVLGEKGSDILSTMTQAAQQPPQTDVNAALGKSHTIPPKATPAEGATQEMGSALTASPNVSSIKGLSAEGDGTYDFSSEDDDTLSNIVEARRQIKQRAPLELNLPSVTDFLPAKKSAKPEAIADAGDTVTAPDVQDPTSVESSKESYKAVEEPNKIKQTSQDVDNLISPPPNFRDGERSTVESKNEANSSDGPREDTFVEPSQHGEPESSQDTLPDTSLPVQEEGTAVVPQSERESVNQERTTTDITTPIRSSLKKSVGEAITITTPTRSSQRKSIATVNTPNRSSQRKSIATVNTPDRSSQRKSIATVNTPDRSSQRKSIATVNTPDRSSQRKSIATVNTATRSSQSQGVGEVIAAATNTPATASQSKSMSKIVATTTTTTTPTTLSQNMNVSQVTSTTSTTTTTPIESAPRKSVGSYTTSISVSPQTGEAGKDTSAIRSTERSKMSEASNTGQQGTTANASMQSSTETSSKAALSPQREGDAHDAQETDAPAHGYSSDDDTDVLVFPTDDEDENPDKNRKKSSDLPEDVAKDMSEDVTEDTPLSDTDVPLAHVSASFHADSRNMMSASSARTQKGESSLPKTQATPKEQSSAPITTARVRQMTMREFLEKLKTKPMPPPVSRPKSLLGDILGTKITHKTPAKAPQRLKHKSKKKPLLPATLPRAVTKEVFTHFAKCRVTAGAVDEVVKTSEIFWQNLSKDLAAITATKKDPHRIEAEDVEKLMKRQGLITSKQSLNALVEELLPTEMWKFFMPFPEPAKHPFQPFTGPLFNPEHAAGEEDESEGD